MPVFQALEPKKRRLQPVIDSTLRPDYPAAMTNVTLAEVRDLLPELVERVEAGERITVTRDGKPVMELVPAPPPARKGGLNWEAFEAYKKKRGITEIVGEIPADFDDPLPEDFLITPIDFPPRK